MTKKRINCIVFSMCLLFFSPGVGIASDSKGEKSDIISCEAQLEKMMKHQSAPVFPWPQKEFSLNIIKPAPSIDDEIVKNTFDLNIDYELRIINPCEKKMTAGCKPHSLGPHQKRHNLSRTDDKYSMNIIRPNPGIDSEIVMNTFDPNIDYKLRIIDPYTRKEITGCKGPCFGPFQHKFLEEGKRYETPVTGPAKYLW
jgi:hypothetical protein